jgi:branched-chain amino acid transport system ATP-binding protein
MGHEDVGRVVELIRKVAAGRTIMMVEHNLNVVANLSDIITVLTRGHVLAEGNYADLSKDERVKEAYLGAGHA